MSHGFIVDYYGRTSAKKKLWCQDRIEDDNHLPDICNDGYLFRFSFSQTTLISALRYRITLYG